MLLSLMFIVLSAALVSALAMVARLAHWPAREYLGLICPNRHDTVVGLVLLGIFLSGWAALGYLLGVDGTGYEVKYRIMRRQRVKLSAGPEHSQADTEKCALRCRHYTGVLECHGPNQEAINCRRRALTW